jgi:predicted MFS family arabinose efflux permease
MLGISANMLISLALPLFARTLAGALAGLFLFYFTFEFSVVSVIPLMTELVPEARATMMAGNAAAFSLGRALGSLLGPALYAYGLLAASGIAAAGIDVAAVALLFFFIPADRP